MPHIEGGGGDGLSVSEKTVVRRMSRPLREDVRGDLIKQQNLKFRNLYSSLIIITIFQ